MTREPVSSSDMPEPATLSNEELLRKVIEAQVKGGFTKFVWFTRIVHDGKWKIEDDDIVILGKAEWGVIEILLDTQGCKAAYGFDVVSRGPVNGERWFMASEHILMSWHSCGGNCLRKALETAVSFLPKQ